MLGQFECCIVAIRCRVNIQCVILVVRLLEARIGLRRVSSSRRSHLLSCRQHRCTGRLVVQQA